MTPGTVPVQGLVSWAAGEIARRGWVLREAVPVRARPWASVVCFELDGDVRPPVLWGKAMAPALADEIDVLPVLARCAPRAVLATLAADRAHGRLLLPDGPTVADVRPHAALPV